MTSIFQDRNHYSWQVLSKYYPGGHFGFDREGTPVFIDPIGQIDFRGIFFSCYLLRILLNFMSVFSNLYQGWTKNKN